MVLTSSNISLDNNQYAEVIATFINTIIVRSSNIRLVKLTDFLGNESFAKLTDFGHHDLWVQYYKNDFNRRNFIFRPVYCMTPTIADKPILIRLYMYNSNEVTEKFSTYNSLHTEQALIDLLEAYKGNIIVETVSQIRLTQNYLSDNASQNISVSCLKYQIPLLRTMSPEQRNDAQRLLELVQYGIVKFEYSDCIPLVDKFAIDLNVNAINKKFERPSKKSYLRSSVVHGIMGCGRKRTYTTMFEQIAAGVLEKINICDINKYYAEKVSLVLCETSSIPKWKEELVNVKHLVLHDFSDFDNLTYSFVKEGGVILMDNIGLGHSFENAQLQFKIVQDLLRYDYNEEHFHDYKADLDLNQVIRYHVQDVSKRLPNAKVPLQWLHFRMVLVDDIIDMNEFDVDRADYYFGRLHRLPESAIISDIGFLSWDWSFIHVKTTGYLPTHLPKDWINALYPIISDPQEEIYEKPCMFWKNFHIFNGLQSMQTPISILRKVNLVADPVEISEIESNIFEKINTLCREINNKSLIRDDASLALLGMDIYNIKGLNIPLSFTKSTGIFSLEDAKNIAKEHFQGTNGTTAERIFRYMHSESPLADNLFIQRSLETKSNCSICFDNPSNFITLCGHSFCSDCEMFLRGSASLISCPVCRSKLCEYDWLRLGDTTSITNFCLSKIKRLKIKIDQISSRKRPKRNSSSTTQNSIMILCPDNSKEILKKVAGDYEYLEFKEFIKKYKKENIPAEINALIMVSPSHNSELYQMIVKSTHRVSPLQVYLLYANKIENPKVAFETLVNPLSISRSGTRRQRTE